MALIKCPACGGTVSENASSCPHCGEPIKSIKASGEYDSGTESFHVEAGNRLELSAKVDAEISARTSRLSIEGKNVVNINKSDPQPFTLGVTVWKMDVTIIWNASLDSDRYKQTLYSQALSLGSRGQFSEAIEIYNKIKGYKESDQMRALCQRDLEQRNKANADAAKKQANIIENVGEDPSYTKMGIARYIIGALALLIGSGWIIGGGCSYGGPTDPDNRGMFIEGLVIFGIGLILIIWNRVQHSRYEKKVAEYKSLSYK